MTIVLYANRNVGLLVLSYLRAMGHIVYVIHDGDQQMEDLCNMLGVEVVTLETMPPHDLLLCCHGRKIIPKEYLTGLCVNIHPCLFKYKGHNPVKRYIANKDTLGSVESHYLTEVVDGGDVIHQEFFETTPITDFANFYNIATPYYYMCVNETLAKLQRM